MPFKGSSLKWAVAASILSCALGAALMNSNDAADANDSSKGSWFQPFANFFSLTPASGPNAQPVQANSNGNSALMSLQTLLQARGGSVPPPNFDAAPVSNVMGHKVVRQYPHDSDAFTQGLFVDGGVMYESTGLYGKSSVRKVDIATGKVLQMSKYSETIFGEGITKHSDGSIYGLSWQEGLAFKIDPATLQVEKQMKLPFREGWGITSNGAHLIVSDGSDQLHFVDTSFTPVSSVTVRDQGQSPVPYLNELEYINGKVYANIYGQDLIAIIDPSSGAVESWIDCRGLWNAASYRNSNSVFNGIAYDNEHKKLYVTGKKWPTMYEIQIVPPTH